MARNPRTYERILSGGLWMTIAIAVSVAEGLVLAADGRTTRWTQWAEGKCAETLTDGATKVFPLSPWVAAATYGRSHLQGRTVAGIAGRFRLARPERPDRPDEVGALVREFQAFLDGAEQAEPAAAVSSANAEDDALGFLIAGYGTDGVGKLYELRWPERETRILSTTDAPNYHWRGGGEAIHRLMKGVDGRVECARFDPETTQMLAGLEYAVNLRHMSLQDAIGFARLLGEVAIGVDRFVSGTLGGSKHHALVGGQVAVAVVTDTGFRLVQPAGVL